ncbi:MAG: hypothetical protein NUV65_05320 [Candidatus Roizmanbacteria bacterium]|nr:hypothetical protein [Candidatus Roizmanbacteria bacterium]
MSEYIGNPPDDWIIKDLDFPYYCQKVPMVAPYEELRMQDDILRVIYRRADLINPQRFQLLQRAGKVCYEAAGIVADFLTTFEPNYKSISNTLIFDHPINGGIDTREGGQITNNHTGQVVAQIMMPNNSFVGIVDMASYLFGWEIPIIASGHKDYIHEILSYLYSLHQPDPVTVKKLQIAEA